MVHDSQTVVNINTCTIMLLRGSTNDEKSLGDHTDTTFSIFSVLYVQNSNNRYLRYFVNLYRCIQIENII